MIQVPERSAAAQRLVDALARHIGSLTAKTIVDSSCARVNRPARSLPQEAVGLVMGEIEKEIKLFVKEASKQRLCIDEVSRVARAQARGSSSSSLPKLVKVQIDNERGVVEARGLARQMAAELGFSVAQQTQIATVVSELARNIALYAHVGTISLLGFPVGQVNLQITAEDRGQGIANLAAILDGQYKSKTGMGLGLRGSRKLMDHFDIDSRPGEGTRIVATKYLR